MRVVTTVQRDETGLFVKLSDTLHARQNKFTKYKEGQRVIIVDIPYTNDVKVLQKRNSRVSEEWHVIISEETDAETQKEKEVTEEPAQDS